MASGQFTVVTSNANVDGKVTWSSTPNTSGNYSDVYVEMRLWRSNTGYTTYGTGNFTVNVNGTPVSVSNKSFTLTYNSNTLILSGTVRVTHNSDGKKSITISWSGSSDVFSVTSGSGTAVLDTIPRASSITSSANWTAGSNLTVSISRADADFVHSIYVYVNGVLIKNVGNIATSYTFSWTTAENTSIFNQLNSAATEDTKILLITYEYNGGSEVGRVEKTGTVTAPAASTVTSGTDRYRYVDEDFIIGIARNNSGFTHTVEIKFGTLTFSRTGVGTSVTFTWTEAEKQQIYGQMPNDKFKSGTIYITTYYNGEKVRTYTTIGMEFHVRNSSPIFSTYTYTDTNSAMNTLKGAGNEQIMIQSKSTLVATVINANKATAQNGASITSYVLTLEGATMTKTPPFATDITFDWGVIQASTNQTISIKAYDSRGFYTEVKYTVTVVPWVVPVIKTSAARTNGFENATTLTLSGSISPVSVGGVNKNSLKAADTKYRYRQKGTATWSTYVVFSGLTLTMPNYSATNAAVNGTTGLDNNFAWEIEVLVTDQLGSNTVILQVTAGKPIMMWDDVKKSVGINKFPSLNGYLEVGGSVRAGDGTNYNELGVERVLNSSTYRMLLGTGWQNSLAATYLAIVKDGTTVNYLRINENGTIEMGNNILDGTGALRVKKSGINGGDPYTSWQGGLSYLAIGSETGYPAAYGVVLSLVDSAYRNFQLFYPKNSQALYMRTNDDSTGTWTTWRRIAGEPDFIQASLATGWTRYSNWALPGYYKDNDGMVHLQGMVQGGTKGTEIFTLASGYVPRVSHGNHIFATANSYKNTASPYNMDYSRIYVYTDGRVVWMEGGASSWLSLSGISFFAG